MPTKLRVLLIEDSEDDAALVLQALRVGAWEVIHERVDTREGMVVALDTPWDLIIADYSLPSFSGPAALCLALERASDLPFILISGTVSEENAVRAMRAGADDYFSKWDLGRLAPAVSRELHTAAARREARRVEQELRKRETHLAEALRLAQVGTWHLDLAADAAIWSDEACRIIGFKPEQAGSSFEDFLRCVYWQDRVALLALLRNTATKQFAQDLQMVRADGGTQFVTVRGDIVRDGALTPLEAAGTIQDTTEVKLAAMENERSHQQLTRQNKKLTLLTEQAHRFVDDVSHEFRTPLTVIKEFGAIMADGLAGPITPNQKQYLGIVENAVVDLTQMVEDFLDSSKLRAGRLRVDRQPWPLEQIFARIRPGLERKAATRSITVAEHIDAGLPLAYADEEKVGRVIMNLASNAIKFSPEGSRIELWARRAQEGGLEVGVTDQGPGIPLAQQKQLFERFKQLPSTRTPGYEGFGLGLNIARQLVWLSLGRMNVVSDQGRGSSFSFTLPAHDPQMIVRHFFMRLAECEEAAPSVAVLAIDADKHAGSPEALRAFLAATTRPTDIILDLQRGPARGLLVLGPTSSAEGWAARLRSVHALANTGGSAVAPLRTTILGTFVYPGEASAAAACARDFLAPVPARA